MRDSAPMVDFCGYLFTTPEPNALYMGNASIRPLQPKRYLYHSYLAYMEANGYKNLLSMKIFGLSLESIMREYGHHYLDTYRTVPGDGRGRAGGKPDLRGGASQSGE